MLANDSDPDGQVLDVTVPIGPSNGTIIVSPSGLIRYTPNAGFSGNDVFDYQVSDGAGGTDTATITVNVLANQNPVAIDDAATTSVWPGSVEIRVFDNDGDPDGDALPYRDIVFVTQPQSGFLEQGCAGNCTPPIYTPNQGFSGIDTFTYRAVDELGGQSNVATVTVTVGDVSPPPVALDDVATTFRNQTIAINVLANDTGATSIASVTQPGQGGTTTIQPSPPPPKVQYTPPSGFQGTQTFQYEAEGAGGLRDAATVTVTVQNRAPVAADDAASATTDSPVVIPVLSNDSDADGDTLAISSFSQGTNGAVAQRAQTLEYTSFPGFTGTDTFSYVVDDGFGGSTSGIVTVSVVAGNAPPTAVIAGGDRTITDTDDEPGEIVSLDGTASFDPNGQITNCEWTVNGEPRDLVCSESRCDSPRGRRQHRDAGRLRRCRAFGAEPAGHRDYHRCRRRRRKHPAGCGHRGWQPHDRATPTAPPARRSLSTGAAAPTSTVSYRATSGASTASSWPQPRVRHRCFGWRTGPTPCSWS